jgi:response regulator RpfG family c-di-GMP phosphodiesterase
MKRRILFVDDDPNILSAFQRQLRKHYLVVTSPGGKEGLEAIEGGEPFAVVVSDLRMPEMDGIQFLTRVRKIAPDSVRMMLTGNADLQAAIEAVNEGNIFRLLTKPCAQEALIASLDSGIRQYRLITAERELLERTLSGSIKVLWEVLSLVNPEAFGRASRITRYVKDIARRLQVRDLWVVETAATLSQIGYIILPEGVLKKLYDGEKLAPDEAQLFNMHPFVASDLIANIPRMETVAEIISYQEKHFDGSGIPTDSRSGEDIPLGSRIIKAVLDFDTLEANGYSKSKATLKLRSRAGWYDPKVLTAFESVLGIEAQYEVLSVRVAQLLDNMILARDVVTVDGRLLIARGHQVTRTLREHLRYFAQRPGIREPITVLAPPSCEEDNAPARQD